MQQPRLQHLLAIFGRVFIQCVSRIGNQLCFFCPALSLPKLNLVEIALGANESDRRVTRQRSQNSAGFVANVCVIGNHAQHALVGTEAGSLTTDLFAKHSRDFG